MNFKLSLNHFADWSPQEMHDHLSFDEPAFSENHSPESLKAVSDLKDLQAPASIDWRAAGAVTSVKDQGRCSGCYGFSTAAAMEGAYKIFKGGPLTDFSPQQILDCTGYPWGNSGCQGGYMTNAFNYLKSNKIMTLASYPYTGVAGYCKASGGVVGTTGYVALPANDPNALLNAVTRQPVSIAVSASSGSFYFYSSGVLDTPSCGTSINHAVTLVGYGVSSDNIPYWLVKNSWGASWGNNGYINIKRDMGINGPGVCGILKLSSYPNV